MRRLGSLLAALVLSGIFASPAAAADQPLRRPTRPPPRLWRPRVTVGSNNSDMSAQASPGHDGITARRRRPAGRHQHRRSPELSRIDENYLSGTQNEVFTWFSGFRMKSFGNSGLRLPVTDVWKDVASNYSTGMKVASTGADGSSTWFRSTRTMGRHVSQESLAGQGYTVDHNSASRDPSSKMKTDGLVPLAFGDKTAAGDGLFDIMDMRMIWLRLPHPLLHAKRNGRTLG